MRNPNRGNPLNSSIDKVDKTFNQIYVFVVFWNFFFLFEFFDLIYFGNLRLNFDEDEIPKCVNYNSFYNNKLQSFMSDFFN